MAAKLFVKLGESLELLFLYVLNLGKYDQNYDVRDRSRLLRHLLDETADHPALHHFLEDIMRCEKPMPQYLSEYKSFVDRFDTSTKFSHSGAIVRDRFISGSLSHLVNHNVTGYRELPDFPAEQPDPSVRDTEAKEADRFLEHGAGASGSAAAGSSSHGRSSHHHRKKHQDLEDFLNSLKHI